MLFRLAALLFLGIAFSVVESQTLQTRWTKDVSPDHPHPEYPRPMMVRKGWVNLNGKWKVQTYPQGPGNGLAAPRDIQVPFPLESKLSGLVLDSNFGGHFEYMRRFEATRSNGRTLLHFGAVDWACTVSVNDKVVGEHRGGYDPFSFDITDALAPGRDQYIRITGFDPSDAGGQPRGKQTLHPQGIMYTPTSGIWQTVWLEQVPDTSIDDILTTATIDGAIKVDLKLRGPSRAFTQEVVVLDGGHEVAKGEAPAGEPVRLQVPHPHLWDTEDPHLYDLKVRLLKNGKEVDQVKSYCAFRKVEVKKAEDGFNRIFLNDKPIFLVGPLDQGFWPDGIYTAPTDAAMKYDLEVTKRLGFNFIRKHVKVEPETWYTACDRMGILVMQDMPSGDNKTDADKAEFKKELQAMIDARRNHPCIFTWVLFNEGWGQHDTEDLTHWMENYDKTRFIHSVTGWTDKGVGALSDIHAYPGPAMPKTEEKRASFLGEFGGLGLPTPGHMWLEKGWGYQSFKTPAELTDRFVELFTQLRFLKAQGLTGAVYTQTTDVETELNGLITYDREALKMDQHRVRQAVDALAMPPPVIVTVVPTSEHEALTWRFATSVPSSGWEKASFDDSSWSEGKGGFGTAETPGAVIGTVWNGKDIWLRRKFNLAHSEPGEGLYLRLHHDDEVEVYLDGALILKQNGWTTDYQLFPIHVKELAAGHHTLAIHCHQDEGGQYIDAGFVRVREHS